jgi:transposase-like protein
MAKKTRRKYTPEEKTKLMARMHKNGESPSALSKETGIPRNTLAGWRDQQMPEVIERMETEAKDKMALQFEEYLDEIHETELFILRSVRNERYIRSQKASDLGLLFGVIDDKKVRVLEAAERAARIQAEGDQHVD